MRKLVYLNNNNNNNSGHLVDTTAVRYNVENKTKKPHEIKALLLFYSKIKKVNIIITNSNVQQCYGVHTEQNTLNSAIILLHKLHLLGRVDLKHFIYYILRSSLLK